MKLLSLVSHLSLNVSPQEGQSAGPPPLIPGLGQQGAQGRIPPLNPGQGPGPNKGKYVLGWGRVCILPLLCAFYSNQLCWRLIQWHWNSWENRVTVISGDSLLSFVVIGNASLDSDASQRRWVPHHQRPVVNTEKPWCLCLRLRSCACGMQGHVSGLPKSWVALL